MSPDFAGKLKSLGDAELLDLLDTVSAEVKRRNVLMGSSPALSKEQVKVGLDAILDALSNAQPRR